MTDIKKSALELIGNTPLLEPENYERKYELTARLFLKLESFNPAGSIKDRAALFMIEEMCIRDRCRCVYCDYALRPADRSPVVRDY